MIFENLFKSKKNLTTIFFLEYDIRKVVDKGIKL